MPTTTPRRPRSPRNRSFRHQRSPVHFAAILQLIARSRTRQNLNSGESSYSLPGGHMPASPTAAQHRRLSIAMIVRDEADLVAASLSSVRPVADQIIIVDTGSRDRTREVALQGA